MKKMLAVLILVGLLMSYAYSIAFACEMKLTPDKFNVKVGEKVTFTLERIQVHRNCVLPLEETKIEVKGGKVVDPGKWIKKDGVDILKFVVQFTTPGEASVTIIRDCPKEGLQTVTVKGVVSK